MESRGKRNTQIELEKNIYRQNGFHPQMKPIIGFFSIGGAFSGRCGSHLFIRLRVSPMELG
jgi:hypothetical protein